MNRAIFIDKDGTLLTDVPYNVDPEKVSFSPLCMEGLRDLQSEGFMLIIITNQSGIARGYFDVAAFHRLRSHVDTLLREQGIKIHDWFFCPHYPEGKITAYAIDCDCRKPKPGLIKRAARKFNIDLTKSWIIGDILHDIEAGNRAGCRTILINNGNETEWNHTADRKPTHVVSNINEAAEFILQEELV
jgi:D-glycero-D-manno-heptose 1,7-bisphosphate phosphatase